MVIDEATFMRAASDAGRAQIAAEHAAIALRLEARALAAVVTVAETVVLVPAYDIDTDDEHCPRNARVAVKAGISAGWAWRMRAALAARPKSGLLRSVVLRLTRRGERVWVAWWNGDFNAAQYWCGGVSGAEPLGWARLSVKQQKCRSVLDVIEGIQFDASLGQGTRHDRDVTV